MATRQPFTKEFKLDAIRLWKSAGRPAAAVARELGLRRSVVRPLVLGAMSHKMAFLQQTGIFVEKTPEPSTLPDRLTLFSGPDFWDFPIPYKSRALRRCGNLL